MTGRDHREKEPTPVLTRQALHSAKLTITHPRTGNALTFEAPYPPDLVETIKILRAKNP